MSLALDFKPRTEWLLPDGKASVSSLTMFNDCPECWMLKYVEGLPTRSHVALPRGSAFHAGLQHARQSALETGAFQLDEVLDVARDVYRAEAGKIDPALLDMGDYASHDAVVDDVVLFAGGAAQAFVPSELETGIWMVEARVDFDGIFPFAFEGYADCILSDLTIVDAKSASRMGEPDAWNRLQLWIYGLPFHVAGQSPTGRIAKVWPRNDRLRGRIAETRAYDYTPTNEHFAFARRWVMQTAGQITDAMRSGDFPARPSFKCKFPHFDQVSEVVA